MGIAYEVFVLYGFQLPDEEVSLHIQASVVRYADERPDTGDAFCELIRLNEWSGEGCVVCYHPSEHSILLPSDGEIHPLPSSAEHDIESYDEAIRDFCEVVEITYRKPSWLFGVRVF